MQPASPAVQRTPNLPERAASAFGKYREIIIAVALFLLFDLGVLVLNFYTSFQIAQDAVGINLSGRQRMLSPAHRQGHPGGGSGARQGRGRRPGPGRAGGCRAAVRRVAQGLPERRHSARRRRQAGVPASGRGRARGRHPGQGTGAVDALPAALAPVLAGSASDAELQAAVDYARPTTCACWA
jgi:two-component system chemotaxis sensor kinase CheA